MTTKDRILKTALELFNQQGTDAITVRHIAKEMNISHGNLCYHYPNTDAIIEGLYHQMVTVLNQKIGAAGSTQLDLQTVYVISRESFQVFYEYRFLMLDYVRIMRRVQPVYQHYQELMCQRKLQFSQMFRILVANKLLKPEQFAGQFDAYLVQAFVFGDFWISNAEVLYQGPEDEKVAYYHRIYFDALVPYLTEQGWNTYQQLIANA